MTASPDFSTFTSRLHFYGRLTFDSGLRIGASRSTKVDEPDLPILRDALGNPYIPGSSFKGALRSNVEAILRTLQTMKVIDRNLACLSVGKPEKPEQPEKQEDGVMDLCLTQKEVSQLKEVAAKDWSSMATLPAYLQKRLESLPAEYTKMGPQDRLDIVLRELSCWTCRLFGSSWLASKVAIRDLNLAGDLQWPAQVRDGVAIDRDSGRAADGMKYQFEALALGATFQLEILVDNASDAELGVLWLGISAFERGEIQMGGARSRGLGWCRLEPELEKSSYIDQDGLLDALFSPSKTGSASTTLPTDKWIQAFRDAIMSGGGHA